MATTTLQSHTHTLPHPWHSSRLVYRAIEAPEDDEWFVKISRDAHGYINSHTDIAKPQSRIEAKAYQEIISKQSLLAVMICLPSDSAEAREVRREERRKKRKGRKVAETEDNEEEEDEDEIKPLPVGTMHLGGIPPASRSHRRTYISIDLLPEFQGKGYGSEAIRWLLEWAFDTAGLHCIAIGCFEYNDGARRLYSRLGFVEEGRERHLKFQFGRWWDGINFSMLEDEWRASKAKDTSEQGQ